MIYSNNDAASAFKELMIYSKETVKALVVNYVKCFKKSFDIKNRASRYQFWGFITAAFGIASVLEILYLINNSFAPLSRLYLMIIFVPTIAVAIRRLHDTGQSAITLLLTAIYTTVLYFGIKALTNFFILLDLFGLILALIILFFPLAMLLRRLCLEGNSYENNFGEAILENKIQGQLVRYLGVATIILYLSLLIFHLVAALYEATGTFNIFLMLF